MTIYEKGLEIAAGKGCSVKEYDFGACDGLIIGNRIGIRKTIETSVEKSCVLAEEIAHFDLTVGDITDLTIVENRRQERAARMLAYNKRIGVRGIIDAFEVGCRNRYEMADYLEVTEEFLDEALKAYKGKYGLYKEVDNYLVCFEPTLAVLKLS